MENSNDEALRLPETSDPSRILITGLRAGVSRLTLTDEDNAVDKLIVIVEKQAAGGEK